jgi:hypothetical protein
LGYYSQRKCLRVDSVRGGECRSRRDKGEGAQMHAEAPEERLAVVGACITRAGQQTVEVLVLCGDLEGDERTLQGENERGVIKWCVVRGVDAGAGAAVLRVAVGASAMEGEGKR